MQACAERDELTERCSTMTDMIKSLEAELQSSSTSLSTANAEVSRHRSSANQLQVSDVSEAKIGMCYSCHILKRRLFS